MDHKKRAVRMLSLKKDTGPAASRESSVTPGVSSSRTPVVPA